MTKKTQAQAKTKEFDMAENGYINWKQLMKKPSKFQVGFVKYHIAEYGMTQYPFATLMQTQMHNLAIFSAKHKISFPKDMGDAARTRWNSYIAAINSSPQETTNIDELPTIEDKKLEIKEETTVAVPTKQEAQEIFKRTVSERRDTLTKSCVNHSGTRGSSFKREYTKKELDTLNGPLLTLECGKPISWDAFTVLPIDLQKKYIQFHVERFNISSTRLAEMFGIYPTKLRDYLVKKDIHTFSVGNRMSREQVELWESIYMKKPAPTPAPTRATPEAMRDLKFYRKDSSSTVFYPVIRQNNIWYTFSETERINNLHDKSYMPLITEIPLNDIQGKRTYTPSQMMGVLSSVSESKAALATLQDEQKPADMPLNLPLSWAAFKSYPMEEQKKYIKYHKEKYNATPLVLSQMFGILPGELLTYCTENKIADWKSAPNMSSSLMRKWTAVYLPKMTEPSSVKEALITTELPTGELTEKKVDVITGQTPKIDTIASKTQEDKKMKLTHNTPATTPVTPTPAPVATPASMTMEFSANMPVEQIAATMSAILNTGAYTGMKVTFVTK